MLVIVNWTELNDERHPLWRRSLCLYAYLHPTRDWVLYVGKADFSSVRSRLHGSHKMRLFGDIATAYSVDSVRVLHGEIIVEKNRRRSSELLADVESLLIMRLQPYGNIQARRRRISRPGLRVHCIGAWPRRRCGFHDQVA
jgi:hypothetical protein